MGRRRAERAAAAAREAELRAALSSGDAARAAGDEATAALRKDKEALEAKLKEVRERSGGTGSLAHAAWYLLCQLRAFPP